jgi:hypothetical protein
MLTETDEYVILGRTAEGALFTPADWAERLCRAVSHHARHPDVVEPLVRAIRLKGVKGLVVDGRLAETDRRADRFLRRFASDNALVVRPGRAFDRRTLPDEESGL